MSSDNAIVNPENRLRQHRLGGKRILYLTFDGVLQPLGQSQVLSYICRLSERGFSYVLLSLERQQDLDDVQWSAETEERLRRYDIDWFHLPYRFGGTSAALRNLYEMTCAARALIQAKDIHIVHARAHVTTIIGWYLHFRYRTPYLFDARGYLIEEKLLEGQWFTKSSVYTMAKWLERHMFRSAAGVVTLTQLMAGDLRAGVLRGKPQIPIATIPTCVDFDDFSLSSPSCSVVPEDLRELLKRRLVVGLVGAINESYHVREGLALFRLLRERRADAHLLGITQQSGLLLSLAREAGIPDDACTIAQATHQEMPDWLRLMDWGLLLLSNTFAKRGSMPTKLAEMLACGVRPIHYGCNSEVTELVHNSGSGLTLRDLSEEALVLAAKEIAERTLTSQEQLRAREVSVGWFSLESGVNKYEALLTELLVNGDKQASSKYAVD